MKKALTLLFAAVMLLCMAACGNDPAADQIAGSYRCTVTEYTQYQKNGQWRDTSYVYKNDGTVTITKVDDKTVSVSLSSHHAGEATFANAVVTDLNTMANISGSGSITLATTNFTHDARLSGTYSYDRKNLAVSTIVQGVSPKITFSFTNN